LNTTRTQYSSNQTTTLNAIQNGLRSSMEDLALVQNQSSWSSLKKCFKIHDLYEFLCENQFENSSYEKGACDLLGILKRIFQKSQKLWKW